MLTFHVPYIEPVAELHRDLGGLKPLSPQNFEKEKKLTYIWFCIKRKRKIQTSTKRHRIMLHLSLLDSIIKSDRSSLLSPRLQVSFTPFFFSSQTSFALLGWFKKSRNELIKASIYVTTSLLYSIFLLRSLILANSLLLLHRFSSTVDSHLKKNSLVPSRFIKKNYFQG